MKTRIILCFACLLSVLASAQKLRDNEVPEVVKGAFAQKFMHAKEVKWSKEGASEFEVEFEMGGQEQTATFGTTGKWLETETEIKKSELPPLVQSALAKEFAGYKVEEAEKVESSDPGTFYEVELKNGKIKYEVQLSGEGKVLKKEEVKAK